MLGTSRRQADAARLDALAARDCSSAGSFAGPARGSGRAALLLFALALACSNRSTGEPGGAASTAGEAKSEPDGVRAYYKIFEGREPIPAFPINDAKTAHASHYEVEWKGGRVVKYTKVNPAGLAELTTQVEYLEGGGRKERTANAYGIEIQTETVDANNMYSQVERSGNFIADGCFQKRREYGASGRLEKETCLDDKGRPVIALSGCFGTRTAWRAEAPESEACLNESGAPTVDSDGVHRTAFKYDDRGLIIEEAFYSATGERVARASDGCAVLKYRRFPSGAVEGELCENAALTGVNRRGSSYSQIVYKVDENGCDIEKRYVDASGAPATQSGVAYSVYKVDAHCGILREEHRDAEGKLAETDIAAVIDYERDAQGYVTGRRCAERNGPVSCQFPFQKGAVGSRETIAYDDRGRVTSWKGFLPNGSKSRRSRSYAHEFRQEYSPGGLVSRVTFYDENGKRTRSLGVSAFEYTYTPLGRLTSERFLDAEDHETRSQVRCSSLHRQYDAAQRLTAIECHGEDGALTWAALISEGVTWPRNAARVSVERTASGGIFNVWYSPGGEQLKRVDCIDLATPCHR